MNSVSFDEMPAGFWVRLLAHLVDNVILFFLTWLVIFIWLAVFSGAGLHIPDSDTAPFALISLGLHAIVAGIYYTVAHTVYGTTLGKWPLGITVVDIRTGKRPAWAVSALRSVGYLASHLTLEIGYIMAAFSPERRALHEIISKTRSVRRP